MLTLVNWLIGIWEWNQWTAKVVENVNIECDGFAVFREGLNTRHVVRLNPQRATVWSGFSSAPNSSDLEWCTGSASGTHTRTRDVSGLFWGWIEVAVYHQMALAVLAKTPLWPDLSRPGEILVCKSIELRRSEKKFYCATGLVRPQRDKSG